LDGVYRPVIKIGPKGTLGSHEIRPIHSAPSLGQSIELGYDEDRFLCNFSIHRNACLKLQKGDISGHECPLLQIILQG